MPAEPEEWFKQAQYDMETAEYLRNGGRYSYAVFMCHLSIEKALKGLYCKELGGMPPKLHNLLYPDGRGRTAKAAWEVEDETASRRRQGGSAMADGKILQAVRFLEQRLRAAGLSISKIILFGSHATGNPSPDSDVDIAIISEDFRGKDIFERAELTRDAEIEATREFLIPFDIVTLTPEELEGGSSLIAQFVSTGKTI